MQSLRAPVIAAALLLAGAAMFAPAPATAGGDDLVDTSIFYEELDDDGDWFEHPRHGYVWSPDVDPSWRPYSCGRWIYTDEYGWFWDSDEPFGWAVYHYGRWGFDEADGWYWVPGRRWGPAWVAWRYGDDYAGWAPLPPGAVWSRERGIVYENDFHVSVRFDPYWLFVRPQFLAYNNAYRYARPRNRYRRIFRDTRPAAGIVFVNGRIFFRGIGPRRYRRIARRSVPRTRINFYYDNRTYKRRAKSRRGSVRVFRPGKKWRYRAKRRKAPRVVYKTSPRRKAWKRRGRRPAAYRPGSVKAKSWRAERDRRKARARKNGVATDGGKPKSKSSSRRLEGSVKQEVRKSNTEQEVIPTTKPRPTFSGKRNGGNEARPPKRKSKARNKARSNRKAKVDRNARPKRKEKRAGKSANSDRGKRTAKRERKGDRKRDGKETTKNKREN